MNGRWLDGWMVGWLAGWMDENVYICMYVYTDTYAYTSDQ